MTSRVDTSSEVRAGDESPQRRVGDQLGRLWWVLLVAGALSIGLGLAILATDWTIHALVVMAGVVLILRGLALALHPGYAADGAGEQVVAGIVGVVGGVILVVWPKPTLLVLAVLVGAWLAVSGSVLVVASVARRKHLPHWGLGVAGGVVELLLGIWVMRRPDVTLALVVTVLGLWTVITGVIYCVQAFEIRNARESEDSAR